MQGIDGGFVWEWSDHAAILGQTQDGKTMYGYGGDFNERHHDNNFCMDALTYPDRTPHTGLLELKQVYRPIRVMKGKSATEFIFKSFLCHSKVSDFAEFFYEISFDGGLSKSKLMEFEIDPLGECSVEIPKVLQFADKEAYIRFVFITKKDLEYCEKGYEICFDQIKLEEGLGREPENLTEKETAKANTDEISADKISADEVRRSCVESSPQIRDGALRVDVDFGQ